MLAEKYNVTIENGIKKTLDEIQGLCTLINDTVNNDPDCVKTLFNDMNVRGLIAKIPERIQY